MRVRREEKRFAELTKKLIERLSHFSRLDIDTALATLQKEKWDRMNRKREEQTRDGKTSDAEATIEEKAKVLVRLQQNTANMMSQVAAGLMSMEIGE